MSGLDKILNEIKAQSDFNAQKILSEAKAEADAIHEAAMADASAQTLEIERNAEAQIALILKKAESTKELNAKRIVLTKKQEIISSCIKKAKEEVENSSKEEYFAIIKNLLEKYATGDKGEIKFAKKYADDIPADITSLIKKKNLTISPDTTDSSGGFLLIYGKVEHNATFDAIFEANKNEISDKVYAIIFN